MKRYTLLIDIQDEDYPEMKKGSTVYKYNGCTYGCCGQNEIPVTVRPGKIPFIGIDEKYLKEII